MNCKFVKGKVSAAVMMVAGLIISGCHTASTNSRNKEHQTMNHTDSIRLEHVAINVEDPVAMAKWYCENLGMRIVRQGPPPANGRFISDAGGNMMVEIYHNPPDAVPDYTAMDPLLLHIAFMVNDVKGTCRKLVAAGATVAQETYTTDSGDEIAMLRDPWGVPIQFLKRADPMLSND